MKSQSVLDIKQGDTAGIWRVGHVLSDPGVAPKVYADLTTGYSCKIRAVYEADGTEAVAERAVSDLDADNTHFLAALLPAETASLNVGKVIVAVQLQNLSLTPPLRAERHYEVNVFESLAANQPDP